MADKAILDATTIAGGGFVSYASILGDIENWLGFSLIICTLVLTIMRIVIAINEWKNSRDD
ncbi:MAG: hypothetical protein HRU28_00410 [Rhizobiales bacterium]|nr:hypothetical protein [Hyphomicrobiales bacterium]